MIEYQYKEEIEIPVDDISLPGDLSIPVRADSIIIFAHGSGSSRQSPRNKAVAMRLQKEGFATLLFDLLTPAEDAIDSKRFEISLLSERLLQVTRWLKSKPEFNLNIGFFGASTGSAATLEAAAQLGDTVRAIVSRGGRPDLALTFLPLVKTPTLLMAGSLDEEVIQLNKKALDDLPGKKELVIIKGASHLFQEPGKLDEVAEHAAKWFAQFLRAVYV